MNTKDLLHRLWMRALRALGSALLHAGYRLDISGAERVPRQGGVLVVSNHVTVHDWLFVGVAVGRRARFVMHKHHFRYPALRAFFRTARVIPIAPRKEDPETCERALEAIDAALARGELVVMSPEGTMTPDGRLSPFRPGLERIVARRPVPVVPIGITGLFGSFFSRAHGAPMSGWPRRFRARVTVRVGEPLPPHDATIDRVRVRIEGLLGPPEEAPEHGAVARAPAPSLRPAG